MRDCCLMWSAQEELSVDYLHLWGDSDTSSFLLCVFVFSFWLVVGVVFLLCVFVVVVKSTISWMRCVAIPLSVSPFVSVCVLVFVCSVRPSLLAPNHI